jgi:hypothetical protein
MGTAIASALAFLQGIAFAQAQGVPQQNRRWPGRSSKTKINLHSRFLHSDEFARRVQRDDSTAQSRRKQGPCQFATRNVLTSEATKAYIFAQARSNSCVQADG